MSPMSDVQPVSTYVVRFIGDPIGYVIHGWFRDGKLGGWKQAKVGRTDRVVRINTDLAYVIERVERL